MNSLETISSILSIVGLVSVAYTAYKRIYDIEVDCKSLFRDKAEYYSKYINSNNNKEIKDETN